MKERKTVTKALAEQYRRYSKKEKGELLERLVEATGYDRHYAAWLLRHQGKRVHVKPGVVVQGDVRLRPKRQGCPKYGPVEVRALKKVWEMLDLICGKRLAPALREQVPRLVKWRELQVSRSVQNKLVQMSPATIDRLLKPERDKHKLKGRAATKPGSLLKHQVPVRTFSDWDQKRPGFFEMDLVGHEGGNAEGDYCFTLDLTDVATGWTELAAVPNKAQKWVFEALQTLRRRLPFKVLGLDSDNGSEFINHHLVRYCDEQKITFTRSRPSRKNDNCYVEQKNWSIVRRYVGYARYDTPEALALLNELYDVLSDYVNFFVPSMKLKHRTRIGARVQKHHDTPKTPYHRLMDSSTVPEAVKERLRRKYDRLNLAAVYRQVVRLQKKLERFSSRRLKQKVVA